MRSKSNVNNIEEIFGKFEANFQKLIEENIDSEDINFKNNLIFIDPTIHFSKKKDIPLLNQIQKRLIDNKQNEIVVNK